MTELKTLKDLKYYASELDNGADMDHGGIIIREKRLKAEAVKWVKEFQGLYYESMHGFIKTFFNLTEEDLEGGK